MSLPILITYLKRLKRHKNILLKTTEHKQKVSNKIPREYDVNQFTFQTSPHLTLEMARICRHNSVPPHYGSTYFFLTSIGLYAQGANRGNDLAQSLSLAICDRKKCNYLFPLEEKGSCENVT